MSMKKGFITLFSGLYRAYEVKIGITSRNVSIQLKAAPVTPYWCIGVGFTSSYDPIG